MTEVSKETVIIVHGTWAKSDPVKRKWYEPADGRPGGEPFTEKLDAALRERGSSARCWAHCTTGSPIFAWSGENNWIARTHAASALVDYVAELQKQGWHCHIIAHSHGGNIVVEALPQILDAAMSSGSLSKIVTLGTPFIDTRTPMQKKEKWATTFYRRMDWLFTIFVAGWSLVTASWYIQNPEQMPVDLKWILLTSGAVLFILVPFLLYRNRSLARSLRSQDENAAWIQPHFLGLGSGMDEAWQILHHVCCTNDPLAVKLNLISYLFSSLHSRMSRAANMEHILSAKPFTSLGRASMPASWHHSP